MPESIKFLLIGAAIIAVLIAVTSGSKGMANKDADVAIDEALRMWQNKQAKIIDVRTPEEYSAGHIPGVPLIPLDKLADRANEVPKNEQVLLICRSGNRSSQGTNLLREKGFTNVYNITGGMLAWRGPVEK